MARRLQKNQKMQHYLGKFFHQGITNLLISLFMILPYLGPQATAGTVQDQSPHYGGTLRLGTYGKPAAFNPLTLTDSISNSVMDLIFNKLIRLNENAEFEPDLAESWNISEDGLIYSFNLKRGVKFHDGTNLSSRDVLHSYQLLSNPKISPLFYPHFDMVKEWSAPTEYSFRVVLKKPHASFLLSLWYACIVPEHLLRNPEKDLSSFSNHPVGSGPFVFANQTQNGDIELAANDSYFEGKPYLNKIHITIFPAKSQIWSAFLRDELDVLFFVDRKDYEQIQDHSQFKFFRGLSTAAYALVFNLEDKTLANPMVRRAISLAIDRKEILEALEGGEGIIIDDPFYPQVFKSSENRQSYEFDPVQSRALLHNMGFINQDGILEKNNQKFFLELLVDPANEYLMQMAKLIRQQLQEIGIRVKFSFVYDLKALPELLRNGDVKYQCYLFSFNTGMGGHPDVVSLYWGTHGRFNYGHYSNPEVDRLLMLARKSASKSDQLAIYSQIHDIIKKDRPSLFFYIPYLFHATSKRIFNFEKVASGSFVSFYQLKSVYKLENKDERG